MSKLLIFCSALLALCRFFFHPPTPVRITRSHYPHRRHLPFWILGASWLMVLSAQAVVLDLREKQTVIGATLTLNDLVQSSQGLTADQLATHLAPAPNLGQSETWTRDRIESVLPSAVKLHPLDWTGAIACEVNRPALVYGETEVRQVLATELIRHLQPGDEFEILEFAELSPFPIPGGNLETQVILASNALHSEWAEATLQFRVEGQLAVTKSVRFHWTCHRSVWLTAARVNPGEGLATSSFQQVEMDILKLPGQLEPARDFPQNKVASHVLEVGQILYSRDAAEPRLIARNDLVTVLYNHNGISITMQAKALGDGVRDAIIQVENLNSEKVFNARVVNERTVAFDE